MLCSCLQLFCEREQPASSCLAETGAEVEGPEGQGGRQLQGCCLFESHRQSALTSFLQRSSTGSCHFPVVKPSLRTSVPRAQAISGRWVAASTLAAACGTTSLMATSCTTAPAAGRATQGDMAGRSAAHLTRRASNYL